MKLVILIPAFNEAESIAQVIRSMPDQIEGITQIQVLLLMMAPKMILLFWQEKPGNGGITSL